VIGREFDSVKYYEFIMAQFASNALIISRTGYSGEDGFEIYAAVSVKPKNLWNVNLMDKGQALRHSAYWFGRARYTCVWKWVIYCMVKICPNRSALCKLDFRGS
jgi:glycine cleavage system aminomethyltransferase T